MEQVKEFITDIKKTATMGLIASIIILIWNIVTNDIAMSVFGIFFSIIEYLPVIALVIYFIMVCMKLYINKGNAKLATNFLIISYFIVLIENIIIGFRFFHSFDYILSIIFQAFIIIYLYNILFRTSTRISNRIFAVVIIAEFLYWLKNYISYADFSILSLIYHLLSIMSMVYFYTYYEVLKGEKLNTMEDKERLEGIGITIADNQEISKDTINKLYEVFCREIKQTLKAPATAVFCKEEELIIDKEYGYYIVTGWVDSQNSYGAMIRTYYNKFKIANENGIFIPKSNASHIASKKLAGTLASYWIYGVIMTLITSAFFYFILSNSY